MLGEGQHVACTADAGPARRYRDFLAVSRGAAGSWSAPVPRRSRPSHDLGLVVIWDDGDDLYAEPRAPYPHTRETLLLRAEREGTAALVGGFARSVEADQLLRSGWAHELAVPRERLRERVTVAVAGASDADAGPRPARPRRADARPQVHDAIREALDDRSGARADPAQLGYAAALACERCRTPARCPVCPGPLALVPGRPRRRPAAGAAPTTRPGPAPSAATAGCGRPVVGEARTAEELGRTFPSAPWSAPSGGDAVLAAVDAAAGDRGGHAGRGAGGRGWLRRRGAARHLAGAGPARPAHRGGGRAPLGQRRRPGPARRPRGGRRRPGPPRRSRRWSAGTRRASPPARRRSARSAHLPPASRLATITGEPGAVDDALTLLAPPTAPSCSARCRSGRRRGRGPWSACPARRAPRSPRALGELQRVRSARKLDAVRVQVDPPSL